MGRTYGPESRCCLFLTGPVLPSVSDGVIFIRSSKVVIVTVAVENAKGERKRQEDDESGGQERGKSCVKVCGQIPCPFRDCDVNVVTQASPVTLLPDATTVNVCKNSIRILYIWFKETGLKSDSK